MATGERGEGMSTTEKRAPSTTFARITAHPGATSYYVILGTALILLTLGLTMVLSASTITSIQDDATPFSNIKRQLGYALIAVPAGFLISRTSVARLRRVAGVVFWFTVFLSTLVITPLGLGKGGNTAWILIPVINRAIQPSEFLKVGMILFLAHLLVTRAGSYRTRHDWLPVMAVWFGTLAVVMLGHDLGTTTVVALIALVMVLYGKLPRPLVRVGVLFQLAGAAFLVFQSDSRRERVLSFITGSQQSAALHETSAYQPRHGFWALGTGGIFGVGPGASREKWAYLPEAHNDYIFAIIGEELGLVGTSMVVLLFGLLAWAIFRLATTLQDFYARLLCIGVGVWVTGQALLNIYVVLGLAPVIGVPLPLISAGGSSLIATACAIGVVLACARQEPGARVALAQSTSALRRSSSVIAARWRRK